MSQLAERYSNALYEVTQKNGTTKQVLNTLMALRASLLDNKSILDVLSAPLMSEADKGTVLKQSIGSELNDELSKFFELLTKNNRLAELPQIAIAFENRVAKDLGVESGTVRSAIELTSSEKDNVKALIEKKLSKTVNLSYVVDSQMIGGIEAKVGSYIFENSIKNHMQKLNDFITRRVQ